MTTDAIRRYNAPSSIAAMILIILVGAVLPIIVPSFIDGLSRYRGLETSVAASIMSSEMLGIAVSTAIASILVKRFNRRLIALSALVVVGLATLLCINVSLPNALMALRLAAGLGEGTLIAVVTASLGGTAQPERNFGIFIASMMVMSAIIFRVAPVILTSLGATGLFVMQLVMVGMGLISLPFFPTRPPSQPEAMREDGQRRGVVTIAVVLALSAMLLFYIAIGVVWPFMPILAGQIGVSEASVAASLSNSTFAGLITALGASFLGARLGRILPLLAGGVVLVAGMAALPGIGAAAFAFATSAFMGAWMFSIPYYYGTLSASDPSGRVVAFSVSLQFFALTLGPLIGARIHDLAGMFGGIWFGIALTIVAVSLVVFVNKSAPKTG